MCLSPSQHCTKGPKTIILDGETAFHVWQFVAHSPRFFTPKLGETVICPQLGASPLTNADREIEHTTLLGRHRCRRDLIQVINKFE